MGTGVEFRLLGPVEVSYDGRVLPEGSARERLVLANLLLNAGRTTATQSLVGQLWREPPRSAKAQLHNLVSGLRRRLRSVDDSLIETRPTGYALRLDSHRLDLLEFRRLAEQGRTAAQSGDHVVAAGLLGEALSLWRGAALADLPDELAGELREALHQERLGASEAKLDALLALGEHQQALRDVEPLLGGHPYREGLYRRRMLALAATGRRADALEVYRSAYRRFTDDLGVEPGAELRDLEQRILRGSPVAALGETRLVPRQLPPATPLTGRDELLKQVADQLGDGEVVLLVGPGGVGKSAIAAAAGHRLTAGFPDGQLYADLRGSHAQPADPYEIVGGLLRALGMAGDAVPADREERVAAYRARMAYQRILVVLDDAADAAQLAPLLPRSDRCATVVTSRRHLATVAGVRLPVPALPYQEATRLLADLAGRQRVDAESDAAAEIVALCGALPLAVCVAAARLAVRPQWSLAEFARRLAVERGRLDELSVGDLDVRASIGLSYQALPEPAQRLFRRIGLLGTPHWPAWVAEVLSGGGALEELVDVHLVEALGEDAVGQARYRMHDLIAEYAAERARPATAAGRTARVEGGWVEDASAVLAPVLEGWLALASVADERAGHGRRHGRDVPAPAPPVAAGRVAEDSPREWFDVERTHLLAAVDRACQLGLPDIAGRLALRLSGYLMLRAYDVDRERIMRTAADCVRGTDHDALLVRLLGALYEACAQRAELDKLADIGAEELAAARRLGEPKGHLRALYHAAFSAKVTGRFTEATALAREGEALSADADDTWLASFLLIRGDIHVDLGEPAAGVDLLREAGTYEDESQRSRQRVLYLLSWSTALTEAGQYATAESALAEALGITAEIGDELGTAHVACALTLLDLARGRPSDAEQHLGAALQVVERIGHRTGIALVTRTRGQLDHARGAPGEAIPAYRRSLRIWREIGSPIEVARGLARLECAAAAVGDEPAAAEHRREWRAILDQLDLDEPCLRLPHYLRPPS